MTFYQRTDAFSVGAIGLYLLGKNPEQLLHGDKDGRRDLALKPFCLVANNKGTESEKLVAMIAELLTQEPSRRATLTKAQKLFKSLMASGNGNNN